MEISKSISQVLLKQYSNFWNLLLESINNCPDKNWFQIEKTDANSFWMYGLTVYHIIETTVFYMRDNPEGMVWGNKGQFNWEKQEPLEEKFRYLTKSLVIEYLKNTKKAFDNLLDSFEDVSFFEQDDFEWFSSRLNKYLYLLRHNLMHIGELNKNLRDNQLPRLKWQ